MDNYEDKSDFEINKAVAWVLNLNVNSTKDYDGAIRIQVSEKPAKGAGGGRIGFHIEYYNPCNKASDAWPIIVENKISVSWVGSYWSALAPLTNACNVGRSVDNPLRAAMIVFLKMQEAT